MTDHTDAGALGWSDVPSPLEPEATGWGSPCALPYYPDLDNVMRWDDSGALEALRMSRERKRARDLGLPCSAPRFQADLFNEKIEWNSSPGKLSQEAAEAWAFISDADNKAHSRRKGGGKYGRRKLGKSFVDHELCRDVEQGVFAPTGWDQPPMTSEQQQHQRLHSEPHSWRRNVQHSQGSDRDALQQQQQHSQWRRSDRDVLQEQQQHSEWRGSDRNVFNERQPYRGWGNSYEQPCSSRNWHDNSNRRGVWKPKATNNVQASQNTHGYEKTRW